MNKIRKNEDKEETSSAFDSVFCFDPGMFCLFRRKRNPSSPSSSEGIGAHQGGECENGGGEPKTEGGGQAPPDGKKVY